MYSRKYFFFLRIINMETFLVNKIKNPLDARSDCISIIFRLKSVAGSRMGNKHGKTEIDTAVKID